MSNSTVPAPQVHAICTAFVNGTPMAELAVEHGMRIGTIERIVRVNMQQLCLMVERQGRIINANLDDASANSLTAPTEQGTLLPTH